MTLQPLELSRLPIIPIDSFGTLAPEYPPLSPHPPIDETVAFQPKRNHSPDAGKNRQNPATPVAAQQRHPHATTAQRPCSARNPHGRH